MGTQFKNLIFTNHALERMRERRISKDDVWATWKNPDKSRYVKNKNGWIYARKRNSKKIEVVAKKNEKGEWLIVSAWSKPVYLKNMHKKPFKISSFWFQFGLSVIIYVLYLLFAARVVVQNSCLSTYHTEGYDFSACQLSIISNNYLVLGFIGLVLLILLLNFLSKKIYKLLLFSAILIITLISSYYLFLSIYSPKLYTAPIYLDTVK